MKSTDITLEFNIIKNILGEFALSDQGKDELLNLKPYLNEKECHQKMQETSDARKILDTMGTPPLPTMKEMDVVLEMCTKGAMLLPEQLSLTAQFIANCNRLRAYLKRAESLQVNIAYYGGSICDLKLLQGEIEDSIRNNQVDDGASPYLKDIRRKMDQVKQQVKTKLESILRGKNEWFADSYVSTRNGHFVLPVKKEYKHQVNGTVIETSGSGNTYFIEPSAVGKLQDTLTHLEIEEDNEVRKILYILTAKVEDELPSFKMNMEAVRVLDIVFAKGKLSSLMKGIEVPITSSRNIIIKKGRHPLLKEEICIPLDFQIGGDIRGVIITGPNTGGKTVALKTVGLLSMMAQCGLHVPVGKGSEFTMNNLILCDIGDGQSISENLSTFSSHITNIIDIFNQVTEESLVLLDELGSGTDPAEGMGIAAAILEELKDRGCLFVATTHYPEIKEYANRTKGLINARMAFDRESLRPLYQLEIGEAGESCALYIAKRLGFPNHMIKAAHSYAYGEKQNRDSKNNNIIKDKNSRNFDTDSLLKEQDYSQVKKPTGSSIPKIEKLVAKADPVVSKIPEYQMGDSVLIYPEKEIGIVYDKANSKGEVGVQIKGSKIRISHKRIKLHVAAEQLYPPDYDFSIIFDTVENRKNRHKMTKGHDADIQIIYEKEE